MIHPVIFVFDQSSETALWWSDHNVSVRAFEEFWIVIILAYFIARKRPYSVHHFSFRDDQLCPSNKLQWDVWHVYYSLRAFINIILRLWGKFACGQKPQGTKSPVFSHGLLTQAVVSAITMSLLATACFASVLLVRSLCVSYMFVYLFISNSLLQQALLLMRSVCVSYLFIRPQG